MRLRLPALPELFMEFDAALFGGTDSVVIHELVPDFTTPANSTFTLKTPVPVAAFDPRAPNGRAQIEQPVVATSAYLDSIYAHNMFRVAYRNLGTVAAPVNSYVTNWTVNVSGVAPTTAATYQAAIRWEELRRDGAGALSVFDQGTHAPDPRERHGTQPMAGQHRAGLSRQHRSRIFTFGQRRDGFPGYCVGGTHRRTSCRRYFESRRSDDARQYRLSKHNQQSLGRLQRDDR